MQRELERTYTKLSEDRRDCARCWEAGGPTQYARSDGIDLPTWNKYPPGAATTLNFIADDFHAVTLLSSAQNTLGTWLSLTTRDLASNLPDVRAAFHVAQEGMTWSLLAERDTQLLLRKGDV